MRHGSQKIGAILQNGIELVITRRVQETRQKSGNVGLAFSKETREGLNPSSTRTWLDCLCHFPRSWLILSLNSFARVSSSGPSNVWRFSREGRGIGDVRAALGSRVLLNVSGLMTIENITIEASVPCNSIRVTLSLASSKLSWEWYTRSQLRANVEFLVLASKETSKYWYLIVRTLN